MDSERGREERKERKSGDRKERRKVKEDRKEKERAQQDGSDISFGSVQTLERSRKRAI